MMLHFCHPPTFSQISLLSNSIITINHHHVDHLENLRLSLLGCGHLRFRGKCRPKVCCGILITPTCFPQFDRNFVVVSPSHSAFLFLRTLPIFANTAVRMISCTSQMHGTSNNNQQVLRGGHQVRAMDASTRHPY
jgi:hypothetical protein